MKEQSRNIMYLLIQIKTVNKLSQVMTPGSYILKYPKDVFISGGSSRLNGVF